MSDYLEFRAPTDLRPLSARQFLTRVIGMSVRSYKRIKYGGITTLNGEPVEWGKTVVRAGDVLRCPPLSCRNKITAENLPLDICYEDENILIVNKPSGQLVHPLSDEKSGTLGNAVIYYYQTHGITADFHPVQRLDRNTTGLVVIAKSALVHHTIEKLRHNLFRRDYLAVVEGVPDPPEAQITAPIALASDSIVKHTVSKTGKPCETNYQTLMTDGKLSLVRLRLGTGRTHQIRVHMAHIGCPLAGDDLYGGHTGLIARQALHAYKVTIPNLFTNETICVETTLPADMQCLVEALEQKSKP